MPKTTEELYQELLAQGNQYQQQANDLLSQYDNRAAFSYDPNADGSYQALKNQYVHQGRRAMEDTMGQAAGLTGGYGSSYGQSVGNQAYNEYLTQLNAQIPGLAQQARAAYDAEGQRMLDRYNLALNAANTAYNQGRDALGDLRYQQEWDWQQQQYADQMAYQDWQKQQTEQGNARDYAMYLLQMGITPSAEQLAAAGMTASEASKIANYYKSQMAGSGSGSGSGGGGGRSSSGGRSSGSGSGSTGGNGSGSGTGSGSLEIGQNELNELLNQAANMGGDEGLIWLQNQFDKRYAGKNYSNLKDAWNWLAVQYNQRKGRSGSAHGGTGNGLINLGTLS